MAALVRKQIERGQTTLVGANTSTTVNLATTVDTSKSILLCSCSSGSANPLDYQVLAAFVSGSQIKFDRSGTPAIDCVVEWQVIEFSAGVTCWQYYVTQSATSINTTITSVDLTKAFPIITNRTAGSTMGTDDLTLAEITSATNLQTRSAAAAGVLYVQIVQIDDATIQKFVTTYGTGTTKDLTVSTIDPAKTFWFFSIDGASGIVGNDWPYLSYVNSTTLRFTRADAAGVNFNLVAYVVSVSTGITVQNISTVIASSGTSVTPSISTVVVDRTTLHICGVYQRWASINAADDDAGGFSFEVNTLTTTSFTARRTDAPALAATTNVQVIEWNATSSAVVNAGRKSLLGVGI